MGHRAQSQRVRCIVARRLGFGNEAILEAWSTRFGGMLHLQAVRLALAGVARVVAVGPHRAASSKSLSRTTFLYVFSSAMRPAPHRGLSLMEVILAIAILGGALVTIRQLIRIGARSAAQARDLTMSQLYAESEMNG